MSLLEEVLEDVRQERAYQDERWPIQSEGDVSPEKWLAIITEEVGEFATEVNDQTFQDGFYLDNMRHELIQIAASAIRACQNLDDQFARKDEW